jgi:Arc/MetJ family transcription regulator
MLGFLAAAPTAPALKRVYTTVTLVYTHDMTKRLVDIDEEALDAARSQLGTTTIKATVNEALRLVGSDRSELVRNSMDVLSAMPLSDRDEAWR